LDGKLISSSIPFKFDLYGDGRIHFGSSNSESFFQGFLKDVRNFDKNYLIYVQQKKN
jgi:hypothetical protein